MKKHFLILKASKDICGNEVGLIQNNCELLGMKVYVEPVYNTISLQLITKKYMHAKITFDFVYLCSHGSKEGFETNMSGKGLFITWPNFAKFFCEQEILNAETILLLACCRGGLSNVAVDIMSICGYINYVCGLKWTAFPWDLTTGFIVFLHNLINKNAEPNYAAQKASLATDYTFACYDRNEVENYPNYKFRQEELFIEIGWKDREGDWINWEAANSAGSV